MADPARPYTPETLAEHWDCSPRHIRNMIREGELPAFRLGGKLLRIRPEDVEAYECQQIGASSDTEASTASPGPTQSAPQDDGVISLERQTQKRRTAAPRLDTQSLPAHAARR